MQIVDDLKVHSIALAKALTDIEILKKTTNEITNKIGIHEYLINDTIKVSLEIIKTLKENREMIEKLNIEAFSRIALFDFLSEKLSSTKTLFILFFAFVVIEAYSITPIVFKHIFGW